MSKRKKPTKTQLNIKNINSYINKIGQFFGKSSPEYQYITNIIADFETYENKKGYVNIQNTPENRKQHQKISSIQHGKKSFAKLVKEFEKEVADYYDDLSDAEKAYTDTRTFTEWFKQWRTTWNEEEQYMVSKLADNLGVPFDYETWYQDYEYRRQIRRDLFEAIKDKIRKEAFERRENAAGDTVNTQSGETYTYTNDDLRRGFNTDFGYAYSDDGEVK